ncbi:MAG: thiamine pyrophosphate-dependent enzyme [Acidobacteriota bacterium]
MIAKDEFLQALARLRTDQIVVTCMSLVRPWARYSNSLLDFASADSAMGHTADLSLGLAMAQPSRKVICLNGDGSMLMSLGTFATIVEAGATNLILFVIDNGCYELTGGQSVPGRGRLSFPAMARAAGFPRVYEFEALAEFRERGAEILEGEGPVFAAVRLEAGDEGPLSRGPHEEARYLKLSLSESCREIRRELLNAGK